ncbi:hypothetical protein DPM19_29215 [Actinomadura craniellae]|uniref:Secreted protein n=1 Tax=Actinomadura craniellae TaxID=2231787 RepID=A0A365GY06_9ACTN|nr:DUF6493 family protein [Actinomadura craniellae]RAY11701.1 hypothetical protein DPM19_29215 [Actinomadura craniellae]
MTAWDEVRAAIEAGDSPRTAALVKGFTPAERRAVARELPGFLRASRDQWGVLYRVKAAPLRVAGAGCLGGAAATASWLCRDELRPWSFRDGALRRLVAETLDALADRPAEWRLDVAHRIAGRLRPATAEGEQYHWRLAAELAFGADGTPPAGDAFVLGWIRWTELGTLERDPFLDELVPRLFEAEGAGAVLELQGTGGWVPRLVALSAAGRVKRETLLDGCVSRFLRGGRAQELRWFTVLYDALEPTPQEAAARGRDLARVLPASPGKVAELALREIRRADEAAPLEPALFAEAAEAVLFRPEKKLVRAALTWLDRTARKHDRVDATLLALTTAFGQEAFDLRERAVKVAARHLDRAADATRSAVRDAAAALPAELRDPLGAGGDGAGDGPEPVAELPPYLPSGQPPQPISSPAELAGEVVRLARTWQVDWAETERLLAGLVAFAHREPERISAAFEHAVGPESHWAFHWGGGEFSDYTSTWLWSALRAVLHPGSRKTPRAVRSTDSVRRPVPHQVLLHRMWELTGLVGTVPVLLATPTTANGQIDPAELVARLETLEAAGLRAGPVDLEQALLRLPREIDAATVRRAGALSSPDGRAAAAWMAVGGLPEPTVTCAALPLPENSYRVSQGSDGPSEWLLATVTADGVAGLAAKLCRYPENGRWLRMPQTVFHDSIGWWPAIMPSHPEVIAAHLLPHLIRGTEQRMGQGGLLLGLAEGDGPAGAATAAALCCGLGARAAEERSGAVDALLVLAARGRLPAAELGRALGVLVTQQNVKLNRVTGALREAARGGAHAGVWSAVAAALPALLPAAGERAPAGLPDLVALGAETAPLAGARGEVPGLAAVAARGGTSRLVRESARLNRLLTGG